METAQKIYDISQKLGLNDVYSKPAPIEVVDNIKDVSEAEEKEREQDDSE